MPRARRREVADQCGVQCPEAVRLTRPPSQPQEGEQRECQVPADGQHRTAGHAAATLTPARRAGTEATRVIATWTTATGAAPGSTTTGSATTAATAAAGFVPSLGPLGEPPERSRR